MSIKTIANAKCTQPWTDGYFTFVIHDTVELTEGYKTDYAIIVPTGSTDIDSDDLKNHFEISPVNTDSEITICTYHQDYQVPLISTMAFQYFEMWCPYCLFRGDVFSGWDVPLTPELTNRLEKYTELTKDFLFAHSATHFRNLQDLPLEEQPRLKQLRESGWKPSTKIELL